MRHVLSKKLDFTISLVATEMMQCGNKSVRGSFGKIVEIRYTRLIRDQKVSQIRIGVKAMQVKNGIHKQIKKDLCLFINRLLVRRSQ